MALGKAGKMGAHHGTRQRGPLPSATLGKVTQNGHF